MVGCIGNSALLYLWTSVVVIFHITLAMSTENGTYAGNAEADLIEEILSKLKSDGDKYRRPVTKATDTLEVTFDIAPIHILDFDEKNQLLTTMMWMHMEWRYEDIKWDPLLYDGVKDIWLPRHLLWTPDIVLYNRVNFPAPETTSWLVLTSNGSVMWIPNMVFVSVCPVNMENFPYDVQRCPLKFGSWAFNGNKLNLTLNSANGGLDRTQYQASMEWELRDVSVNRQLEKYECCDERYVHIQYEFVLVRNSTFYTQFLILPTVLLGIVILAIFWIPPTRPDRTGLGMSLFGSFMLLLLLVVQISPPSKTIKLITYCAINITLTAIATVISAFVVNVSRYNKPVPWPVLKILRSTFSSKKFPGVQSRSEEHESVNIKAEDTSVAIVHHKRQGCKDSNRKDWVQFAVLLDRAFFFVYLIVIVTTLVLYLPMTT